MPFGVAERQAGMGNVVGAVLTRYRERQGISGNEAARQAGLSTSVWNSIERGISTPTPTTAGAICRALGIPANEMLGALVADLLTEYRDLGE